MTLPIRSTLEPQRCIRTSGRYFGRQGWRERSWRMFPSVKFFPMNQTQEPTMKMQRERFRSDLYLQSQRRRLLVKILMQIPVARWIPPSHKDIYFCSRIEWSIPLQVSTHPRHRYGRALPSRGKTNRRTRALERMREREGICTIELLSSSHYIGSRRKAKSPLVAATFSEELQLEL